MVNYDDVSLDRVFAALSHPARRTIVERLLRGPTTVGAAASGLAMSKPAISKHVKVLEDAGLLRRVVEGRTHQLSIDATLIERAHAWLGSARSPWAVQMDALAHHLDQSSEANERNDTP